MFKNNLCYETCRIMFIKITAKSKFLLARPNLVPRVFVLVDQRSENESSWSNHFEITKEITEFCPSGFTAQSASMAHA